MIGIQDIEGIRRGQVIYRRCSDVDVGMGVLEVEDDFPISENKDLFLDIVAFGDCAERQIVRVISVKTMPAYASENYYRDHEMASIATDIQSHRARDMWRGGSLIIRATRKTSKNGRKIALMMIMTEGAENQSHHQKILAFDDILHTTAISQIRDETNGMALAQIHKLPIWGWEPVKFGPVSTIRLDVIDECNELSNLIDKQDITESETERLNLLKKTIAGQVVQTGSNDPNYAAFRLQMKKDMPLAWDQWLTRQETEVREQKAAEIIREIMTRESI